MASLISSGRKRESAPEHPPERRAAPHPGRLRVAIVAGEASGDLLGSGLLESLRELGCELDIEGIGGERMAAVGCRSLYPIERLSVMGLFEAFGRYPEIIPLRRRLARRFMDHPPDVFIGVDAPDFNLTLERWLRRAGVPTVHYVSPSVWAWRRYRVRKIGRSVDLMLTLFPFEAGFYRQHGVPVHFVGHPLADAIPDTVDRGAARAELGLPTGGELVALLPGSRTSEVKYLAGPMVRTAAWLARRRPGLRFVVPLVDEATRKCFESALVHADRGPELHLIRGRSRAAMSAANVVLLASGTASLEALLLKRPMVITYRTTELTYRIMKRMLHVPYVGLPNLLAGRALVPELLQHEAVPERLGPALLELLAEPALRQELVAEFTRIHGLLRRGASRRAARAVLDLVRG